MKRSIVCLSMLMAVAIIAPLAMAWNPVDPAQVRTTAPEKREVPGIENVWRLDERIWSGGDPASPGGLERLSKMGVRAIVSVDGAPPDIATARRLGLRYVHVPIGYDGIDESARLRLSRIFDEIPGPIYVHCHHGRHRGPAAAAVMARFGLEWTADEAESFLNRAGTSPDYPGLFASVRSYRRPTAEQLRADAEPLPEIVDVPDMVEMMVGIDERFDRLKAWMAAGEPAQTGNGPMRIDPRQEAVQLRELVRESARLPECRDRPEPFRKSFADLESDLSAWIDSIDSASDLAAPGPAERTKLAVILKQAGGRCTGCHKAFRDR